MHSKRRLVVASAIAVVVTAALLPGSGRGSSAAVVRGAQRIPAGLAKAIRARLGAGAIRSSWASRATDGPFFGYSIAVSADGTTALVGAPFLDRDKGAVYVFHVSGAGSWSSSDTPTAALTDKSTVSEFFGRAVALSADGTTAVVGAPLADGASSIGALYVFHVSAENAWASSSTPKATLKVSHDFVGETLAVSADGTTVVAGAPYYGGAGGVGGAYVFHASSESAWTSTSTPTAGLGNAGESLDDFDVGAAVAISGDGTTALVSDSLNAGGGDAYVFRVSAESAWKTSSTPTAILSNASSGSKDYLGYSLALSGDGTVAFLGALGANARRGAVDVFHSSGAWASTSTPTATLTNAGGSAGDVFGVGVAVSTDGMTALATAPGLASRRGGAYVFRVASEGAWASSSAPSATLTDSSGQAKDELGDASPLSGDGATALLGAPEVRSETGAADVFHVADASSWASSSTPSAILTASPCVVPRLIGLKVRAAKSRLRARHCRLGKVTRVHAKGKKKGRVVSQSSPARRELPHGAKVNVRVAK